MTESNQESKGGGRHVALAWLGLALFDATQTVVSMRAMGMHHAWLTLFFVTMASWAVWPLCTPLVLRLLGHFPVPAKAPSPWAVHALACLGIGLAWATWATLLEHATNPFAYAGGAGPFLLLWKGKFLGNLVGTLILYGAIAALGAMFETRYRLSRQRETSARLAELLAQAQLAALRLQFEPHFIFNALNAVTGLIREKRDEDAVAVVAALGDLLRRVTDRSTSQFVKLEDEVEFLQKYLDIQAFRFGARLRYRIDMPEALRRARVPDFIVQPLVENAIKHGISKRAKPGELQVSVSREGASLMLRVCNDGPLLPAQIDAGVGLSNTRQRLLALYGDAQALRLENHGTTGVLATITLPYCES